MTVIEKFRYAVDNHLEYAKKLHEQGTKIFGYFCTYGVEELTLAAGLHPMRLYGTLGDIALADAHLQSYCCSLVRGALEEALSGKLDFLTGTVFPHTCDSMQRLSDLWRLNTTFPFFSDVVIPVKLNTESSENYMKNVLQNFKKSLEQFLDKSITNKDLLDATRKLNLIRNTLKEVYTLRSENPEILDGKALYYALKASTIMDREQLCQMLPEFLEEIKKEQYASTKISLKRIILSGSICNHPDYYTIIEKAGGVVVWDDMCTGSRSFDEIIPQENDPIGAIAKRYSRRIVCPAKHYSLTARGDQLIKIAKEHQADGVVFLLLKFCDPHAFDYPYIKEILDKENIPNKRFEIEGGIPSEGQLMTRLETFMYML